MEVKISTKTLKEMVRIAQKYFMMTEELEILRDIKVLCDTATQDEITISNLEKSDNFVWKSDKSIMENSEKEKLNFYNCILLVDECIKAGILQKSPEDENSILIYCMSTETSSEGWYAENIHSVARDLTNDLAGQNILLEALAKKNIEFKPEEFPVFEFNKQQ